MSGNDWQDEIAEIRRRQALAAEMGGAERVARQKSRGKLTVRERISALLDPGSFREWGSLAGEGRYDADGRAWTANRTLTGDNSNNRIIDISDAATGTVNHALPIVREIIHLALQKFAAAIICVHNHPSANITPSPEDKKFTQELAAAGKLMGIKVLDHVIIGDGSYFSFADEGLMG